MQETIAIETIVSRWSGLERPLFKGKLIDSDGCKCAQGDVLSCVGFSDEQLYKMEQRDADIETAKALGISVTHSVLLRSVNDKVDGAPQIVLTNPEQVLGDKAPYLLAFWLYLDQMSVAARDAAGDAASADLASADLAHSAAAGAAWDAAGAAWDAAWAAAGAAARDAAWAAAWDVAGAAAGAAGAAWDAAWAAAGAAARSSSEIQSMDKLEADGRQPYFLAFFGLKTWDAVRNLVK
jgi:hypothetical protein